MRCAPLLLLVSLLVTGCSSFDREWEKTPAQTVGMEGRWEGSWVSNSGHKGKLRAVITRQSDRRYDAKFRATYASVISTNYDVPLDVRQRGGRSEFSGEADLGIWGRYETTGHATTTHFHAKYRSKLDNGTFEMERPAN